MRRRRDDVVSAAEIAAWARCPESRRLRSLGHESQDRAALERGEAVHARTAAFEPRSRSAMSLGRRLLVGAALLLVTLAPVPVVGR